MKSEDGIPNALRALAEHDRGREAPGEVETRLLAAFSRKRASGMRARRRLTTVALATLAVAASVALFFVRPQEHREQVAPTPVKQQPVIVAAEPAPERKPLPKVRPLRRQPSEVVTEFFPLLDVSLPFESGELLRVTVPASTMRRVGLPVNEERLGDRIYADVLVGQEGLARAIRFVSYEQ
jgi:hypothetical protein